MEEKDLQQISNLLDEKFEEKFEENNKILKETIVDEIGQITNQAFNEQQEITAGKIERSEDRILRQINNSEDKLMKELKLLRDEQSSNIGAHDRMNEKINDHETRIKKLEPQNAV